MIIQSWDTATTDGEQASYSVCTTWLIHEKKYYLVDVLRERVDYPALKARAISLAKLHTPKAILVEDAGLGSGLVKELQRVALPAVAVIAEIGQTDPDVDPVRQVRKRPSLSSHCGVVA